VLRTVVTEVDGRFDVVVSTNGGYPLDRNLYQAVKGMAAAERVVRPGGTIVMAAECRDGVPGEGDFGPLLLEAGSAEELVDATRPRRLDRWQVQVMGRVLRRAGVHLYSDGLGPDTIRRVHLVPTRDVTATVREAGGRVCVLPYGPLTVATAV
jgi:nickel-dependent lactate racemase